jgi:hypothetical protein
MKTLLVLLLACANVACGSSPNAVATDAGVADSVVEVAGDTAAPEPCDVPIVPPPAELGLDAFYTKYLDAEGVPVVSSPKASDVAVRAACRITRAMIAFRADVRSQMVAHHARVSVMARSEVTTDIPEHADLYTAFPGTDWNVRARGLGGTVDRPATSCAEENVMCDPTDRYRGENIVVHEFAHGIANLGAAFADKTFMTRLRAAYRDAELAGKWKNTYAGSNADEYFAEGVQSYFETNIEAIPSNGIHNEINTRAELETYDPALFKLVAEVFGPARWTPTCP